MVGARIPGKPAVGGGALSSMKGSLLGAEQPRSDDVKFQRNPDNVITVFAKDDRRQKRDNFMNLKKRSPPRAAHKAADYGVSGGPELKVNQRKKARSPEGRLDFNRPTKLSAPNNARLK